MHFQQGIDSIEGKAGMQVADVCVSLVLVRSYQKQNRLAFSKSRY